MLSERRLSVDTMDAVRRALNLDASAIDHPLFNPKDELPQIFRTSAENRYQKVPQNIKAGDKNIVSPRPAHVFVSTTYLALIFLALILADQYAEAATFEKFIGGTTQIQLAKRVYVYTEKPIDYRIEMAPYWTDFLNLRRKVDLLIEQIPSENVKKHIIILDSDKSIVIIKTFVSEEECKPLCNSFDLDLLQLENAQRLNSIPDNCNAVSLQMSIHVNKWYIVCIQGESYYKDEKCYKKLQKIAKRGNLIFYSSDEEFRKTLTRGLTYTIAQNSTHLFATENRLCCACYGSDSKEKDEIVTSIYKKHQSKMKKAAGERLKRIGLGIQELEYLLESMSNNNYNPDGLIEVTSKDFLVKKIKEAFPVFYPSTSTESSMVRLEEDPLYPKLLYLWDQIIANNTDEELFESLKKVRYETLDIQFLTYIYKALMTLSLKTEQKLITLNPQITVQPKKAPLLYSKENQLADIIHQFSLYMDKTDVYSYIHLLKFFESLKIALARDLKRMCNIVLPMNPYYTKNLDENLKDTSEIMFNNAVYPGKLNLPSIKIPRDQAKDTFNTRTTPKISTQNIQMETTKRSTNSPNIHDLISIYLKQNRGSFPAEMEEQFFGRRPLSETTRSTTTLPNTLSTSRANRRKNNQAYPDYMLVRDSSRYVPVDRRYTSYTTTRYPTSRRSSQTTTSSTTARRTRSRSATTTQRTYTYGRNTDKDRDHKNRYQMFTQNNDDIVLSVKMLNIVKQLTLIEEKHKNEIERFNENNIPETNYIYKRMKNKDKNNDKHLDEKELENYKILIEIIGEYNKPMIRYILHHFGQENPGYLNFKEFFIMTRVFEKYKKLNSNLDEPTTEQQPTTVQTSASTTRPILTSRSRTPTSAVPTTTTTTTATTDSSTTSTDTPTDTTTISTIISRNPTTTSTSTTTTTTYERYPITSNDVYNTTPTTTTTTTSLDNHAFSDLEFPPDYFNANLRKKRGTYFKGHERVQPSSPLVDITPKNDIIYKYNAALENNFPEMINIFNEHKLVKRNIITPFMSWWTGLASKESIRNIANDEKAIKENENLFQERIINLTESDNTFRREIKNISVHIATLLGQSTDLSESFLEMMKEETSIEKRLNFVIKSLGQVVKLSISIENLIFHLTSLQEEIEKHLVNIYAVQTGSSILNEQLFETLEKHGGIMTPSIFSNVKYDVTFTKGIFNIKAVYKIVIQKFQQYKLITLPYVIKNEGQNATIIQLDIADSIILNEEREIINEEDLKHCEQNKNDIFCPIKNTRFRRPQNICEIQLISSIIYGKPNKLETCNNRVTYLKHIYHRQEYLQTNKYILLISEFPDTAYWICQNSTQEPINIPPLRITFIDIQEKCILKTSIYRIYLYEAERMDIIDDDLLYTQNDLISNLVLPLLEEYNFEGDFDEITSNIIKASTDISEEKQSIVDLVKQETHLHDNNLKRLMLKPWDVSAGTTPTNYIAVWLVWIGGITIIVCICGCCIRFFCSAMPIIECCCIPYKSLRKFAITRNKKAAYDNIKKFRKDFEKEERKTDDDITRWVERYGESLQKSDLAYDPKFDKIFHTGINGDRLYFDENGNLYINEKRGLGLKRIGTDMEMPHRIRRRLKYYISDVQENMQSTRSDAASFQNREIPNRPPRSSMSSRTQRAETIEEKLENDLYSPLSKSIPTK